MIATALLLTLAAGEPPKAPTDPSQQMICRRETLTGTRFARKICLTRAAREATAEENMRTIGEMRSRSHVYGLGTN